jgi:glutaredoxin-related protein
MKNLLFFYGQECPHCLLPEKYVDELNALGFDIEKREVWHSAENLKILEELDIGDDMCGGLPFFINKKNGKTLCGEVTFKDIKNWAK